MSLIHNLGNYTFSIATILTQTIYNLTMAELAVKCDFAQQYLPEIYEAEVERYGNRTLSGFLRMVGAEMPMTSDQVIWSEQNRLHISYHRLYIGAIAGQHGYKSLALVATAQNVISVNDTVVVLDPATGAEAKGIVTCYYNCWCWMELLLFTVL